jgi:hypothetical protein
MATETTRQNSPINRARKMVRIDMRKPPGRREIRAILHHIGMPDFHIRLI